jgi:hypothetical protein
MKFYFKGLWLKNHKALFINNRASSAKINNLHQVKLQPTMIIINAGFGLEMRDLKIN